MAIKKKDLAGLSEGANQVASQLMQQDRDKADLQNKAALAQALKKQYSNVPISVEGVNIGEIDPLARFLRAQQMKDLQDERERKAIQDVADREQKVGTAQIVPSLRRAEEAVPGLFTSDKPVDLKSIGGVKSLAPTFAVPVLEKIGALPKGASEERAALQELQNAKIYDSSGKQINEAEMKRIQDAMGLRSVFDQSIPTRALRQIGETTLEKQKQVSAGAKPSALKEFERRGGLAGKKTLQELLGVQAQERAPSSQPTDIQAAALAELERRKGKK